VLVLISPALGVLTADELLLVTNKNVEASGELAKYYANARGVAGERILELDLPQTEKILPAVYQSNLVRPIRAYLESDAGKGVRCILLFTGVPLTVQSIETDAPTRAEVAMLRRAIKELDKQTPVIAQDAETFARNQGIVPRAIGGQGTSNAAMRVQSVLQQLQAKAATLAPDKVAIVQGEIGSWQKRLQTVGIEALEMARAEPVESTTQPSTTSAATPVPTKPATTRNITEPQPPVNPQEMQALANRPRDAEARQKLRDAVAGQQGALVLYQVIESQLGWIAPDETSASVDSELALVLFDDYPRYRWQANPLQRVANPGQPRGIMTCRIDAPSLDIARRIIDDAIAVEKVGLKGSAVFDSRGLPEKKGNVLDGYGWYDQAIRNAAAYIGGNTKLEVITDDRPQVILPNTNKDVALYVGWYSLQNYIPGNAFSRGAVGYHVASLELTSLRNAQSKEWVPNMLKDGIAATLGAVGEPYLHAFPRPEEFFPLLLTGDYTVAEVYWRTTPMSSWKLSLIADPLYNPYRASPQLKRADLPAGLKSALDKIEAVSGHGR
jgi:uncharacterized protein (TIGR03790 family)